MMLLLAGIAGLLHIVAATAMASKEQTVLAPDSPADFVRPAGNLPRLADLLTLESRASIFYSYARETAMSALFTQSVSEGEGTTVFVPTNKAVQALARKPHEDPEESSVGMMGAEYDAASKANVQHWVGAHIIPSPDVDFTNPRPYDTLTPGTTITFSAISSQDHRPADQSVIDTDAAHLTFVKGQKESPDNANVADAVRLAGAQGCVHAGRSFGRSHKSSSSVVDTDAAHFTSIKGPASPDHDAPRISNVKESSMQKHIWKQYELNDGVHIISEKKASNGVMYLIDGTVPV